MNEMGKFQRSWLLLKSSLTVIARNKLLLVFPVVTFSLTAVLVLFFVAPAVLRPTAHPYLSTQHWEVIGQSIFTQAPGQPEGEAGFTNGAAAYLAFLYFVSMFFATFFNVAFFHEILAALGGGSVSITRGLKFALTRLKAILFWSLFAGVVGLIIKAIEERLGFFGRIIARLIGVVWSVAAVFVIPIIVQEEETANPITALRKSANILKRTWGEALIGYVGLTFANWIIMIGSLVLLIGSLMISIAMHNYWLVAFAGVGWLITIVAWSYLVSVGSQVYKGALYLYAAHGTIPEPYSQEMLDMAWKFKKR